VVEVDGYERKWIPKGPKEWCDGYFGTRAFWMVLPQTFLQFLFVHHFSFFYFSLNFHSFSPNIVLLFVLFLIWQNHLLSLFFLSFQKFLCFVLVRVTLVQCNFQRKFCFTLLGSNWVAKDDSFIIFFLGRKKKEKKRPHIISNCDCFSFKSFNAWEMIFIHAITCP